MISLLDDFVHSRKSKISSIKTYNIVTGPIGIQMVEAVQEQKVETIVCETSYANHCSKKKSTPVKIVMLESFFLKLPRVFQHVRFIIL